MRRRRILPLVLLVGGLLAPLPAPAQDYSFEVPRLRMQCHVLPDASIRVEYEIRFVSRAGYHEIDVVDIGMPTPDYSLGDVEASIDGKPLTTIRPSQYVTPGVEIHLREASLRSGASGTLRVSFRVRDLVFQDTTRDDHASLRITPTWFDPRFVVGDGSVELAVHLPRGVSPDAALHHGAPFTQKALFEDHAVVLWRWDEPATRQHLVGVSFPKSGMERVVEISRWELLERWLEQSPRLRMGLVIGAGLLFTLLFFRFSNGTGCCLYLPVVGGLSLFQLAAPATSLVAVPALLGLVVLNERGLKRRRARYMPALVSTEGGGIKRGLTAPEAAALLELPIGKVLGLVVFGLLKKNIVRQVAGDGLRVETAPAFALGPRPVESEEAQRRRRAAAQEAGTIVHGYEHPFLDVIDAHPGEDLKTLDFGAALKGLVERLAQRLKGFDVEESREYYRYVVRRALREARSIGEIEQRRRYLDDHLDWVLIDDDSPELLTQPGLSYWPRWHHAGRGASLGGAVGSGSAAGGAEVAFSDVAASFAGWSESTLGNLASGLTPGVLSVPSSKGGFVDLSALDKFTGDVFEALSQGGGGSGGGGGGCACACAGCACACACAGGGR